MSKLIGIIIALVTLGCTQPEGYGLAVDTNRLIEINTVVEAPQILYDANALLKMSAESTDDVYILINSPGGSVYAGLQFISAMRIAKERGVVIKCIVPGMAMSMAFQFFLECTERYTLPYALLLWHPVRIQGMFLLTPVVAQDLANSLLQAEHDLLPLILTTLGSAGMEKETILYHYDMETVWTGSALHTSTDDFLSIVDDVEGMQSIWHVSRMMEGHLGSPIKPTDGDNWDIKYIAPERFWRGDNSKTSTPGGDKEPAPSPKPEPKEPSEPRDCRSCHNKKPGHGGRTIR